MTRRRETTAVGAGKDATPPATDWKGLVAALWVVGVMAVFLRQLLTALAEALGL